MTFLRLGRGIVENGMENQSTKSKKNRRKRKHRGHRGRNSRSSGGSRVFNTSNQHEASLGFPSSFVIPAQSNWFWQNYRQVMDWQGRHQVAYWKSRALAVECQNSILMDYVEKMNDEEDERPEYLPKAVPFEEADKEDEDDIEEETGGESLVFEVNEEMLAFFQQSIKHKQEMKELRDAERSQVEALKNENESFVFPKAQQRIVEGTRLYGKNAPTVMAMETSMQLTFERFVEKEKPRLWPNIPLNL